MLAKTLTRLLIVTSLLGVSACSWFQFPGVYRLTIQQGNIITKDMLEQLEPGMTRRQVNFVLGTPLLIDSFHQDRWDYYYSVRDSEGEIVSRRLTVFFDGDQLSHYEGDVEAILAGSDTLPEAEILSEAEAETEILSEPEIIPEIEN